MHRLFTIAALPLVFAFCASPTSPSPQDGPPPAGMGVLSGTVLTGPISPLGGVPGSDASAPVANAKVMVSRTGAGQRSYSGSTNGSGQYRLFAAPGHYLVTLAGSFVAKDLPASVDVTEGQTTTLDIHVDSGIR